MGDYVILSIPQEERELKLIATLEHRLQLFVDGRTYELNNMAKVRSTSSFKSWFQCWNHVHIGVYDSSFLHLLGTSVFILLVPVLPLRVEGLRPPAIGLPSSVTLSCPVSYVEDKWILKC